MEVEQIAQTVRGQGRGTALALLAAALYSVSAPICKVILGGMGSTMTAAFLYLGAGIGMAVLGGLQRAKGRCGGPRLARADWPYILGMIVLDIAAPILLLLGLERATAANVALLGNFEIVATSVIALLLFRERIDRRLWTGIGLITLSSGLLTCEESCLRFSEGSLFVLLACLCWGFENNCTRVLSGKDACEIVVVKGIGSGGGALVVALIAGEKFGALGLVLGAMLLGFVSYGLSIYCYVRAQAQLGAARTSAFYATAPFIGSLLSLVFFREAPGPGFALAFAIMLAGAWFATKETKHARAK